jgi:AraC-like DNA-binding protein
VRLEKRLYSRGAYVAGDRFYVFHAEAGVLGVTVGGNLPADIDAIGSVMRRENGTGRRLLLDLERLETVERDTFEAVHRWMRANAAPLSTAIARTAVILPVDEYAASLVAGYVTFWGCLSRVHLVRTIAEAERRLGVHVAQTLCELRAAMAVGHHYTHRVARALDRDPTLDIETLARQLCTTDRTLQRRLAAEGTSFTAQSRMAKLRRAKYLLGTTEELIAPIAHAVGCRTSQHFAQLFKAETGMTPTQWRRRRGVHIRRSFDERA